MKKAVLFSNHFRAFDYTVDYFLDYFGEDTDYFIYCWDTEYDFYNVEELINILANTEKSRSVYPAQEQYKINKGKSAFKPLDTVKAEESILKKIPSAKIKWVSNTDFFNWFKDIDIKKSKDSYSNLYKLGFFYILSKGFEHFLKNSQEYDLIFRARFDCIPFEKQWRTDDNTLFVEKVRINNGIPWVADQFFYGTHSTFKNLFLNLNIKLNDLANTPPYSDTYEKLLFQEMLGSIVALSKLNIRESKINTSFIRKEVIDRGKNINNREYLDKITWLYQYLQRTLKWRQQ
tara:strand:+ start:617 stop:1483 length:867 start_codon:yes stop_codon:yes gene_type:complete